MNLGKTLFAQVMDFLPWKTFQRLADRYGADHRVRTLPSSEQFRVMAFAQLTYRESLRDIGTCLAAQASKLYHMGIRQPVARATLADANERRDWRLYAEFAQRLIARARALYASDSFGVELDATVYALDATTIDLCLSMFPWAEFRSTKAAVKLHTLLDLRGAIPAAIDGCGVQATCIHVAHLRIKRFYGTSENAVKTQIWIAVAVYVLVAIIRKELNLKASLHTLLQILSLTLFENSHCNRRLPKSKPTR
jgi:hypothetical protein